MTLTKHRVIKALVFSGILLLFFVACSKHDSAPAAPAVVKPSVTSISLSATDPAIHYSTLSIDSFSYDVYGRFFRFMRWGYDRSVSPAVQVDSFDVQFNYASSQDTVPYSYNMYSRNTGVNNPVEQHLLYYDGQNRIVKDSMQNATYLGSTTNNAVVTTYRYDNNIIVANNYQFHGSGLQKAITDSFYTNGSGNLTNKNYHYLLNNSGYFDLEAFSFTNYANPFYSKTWAKGIGPLLSYVFEADYISPNMFSGQQFSLSGSNGQYNYTWITDNKGRIIQNQPNNQPIDFSVRYRD